MRHPVPSLAAALLGLSLLGAATAATETVSLAPAAETPERLGRLFFTPETRAELDRQRATHRQSGQSLQGDRLTLNGTIVRSNGKRTYWINGRQQEGNALPPGVVATTSRNRPAQTTFHVSGEPSTTLRVGESANRGTEQTEPVIPGNAVVRKAR